MTDRELLEAAAKAAGIEVLYCSDGFRLSKNGVATHKWDPLNSEADAFRLMVKLNLFVFYGWTYAPGEDIPIANVVVDNAEQTVPSGEIKGDDPYAATRRAIVRAAAEIGDKHD